MNENAQKIDVGRLMIIPVFCLLMIVNLAGLRTEVKTLELTSAVRVARLIHCLLATSFYTLIIFLYVIRSAARSTTPSLFVKSMAVIASFLPFAIPFSGSPSDNIDRVLFANLLTTVGMVVALYSLSSLGRSFSIIPQARTLVRTGPYRFVRHPVYLGELIATLGVVVARPSVATWSIFWLIAALLLYRALQEEKLLASSFPEYDFYSRRVARFIPGIF
jgi:protein-S-isoprenylcysteine O-methyltransferase Ste14